MFNSTRSYSSLDPTGQGRVIVILFFLVLASCQTQQQPLKEASFAVKVELLEVKGGIPEHLNYKYVFIMKYRVLDGDKSGFRALEGDTEIYVGHRNPIASRFREGEIYWLALEADLFTIYEGGVVNRYFEEDIPLPYLAVDMK